MTKRLILVVLLLIVIFGGIFGWKYYSGMKMATMMSQPPPPAVIASAEVKAESWQPYLHAVGSVTATQGVFVTTEVAGQVHEIVATSGQKVKAGDVLLRLDDSVDKADLDGLVAQRTLAKLQFERARKLLKDKSVSRSDYDASRANLDSAEAAVAAKRALISKKTIHAPFSGQLGIADINLGQYLSPGDAIVPLQSLDPVYVDYNLPERYLPQVHVGQSVIIDVQAWPGRHFEGRISAINPGVDTGTRTLRLRATLDNPERLLRPGMFAEVSTVLPLRDNILTLPRTAVTYNPYGELVFVIQKTDKGMTVLNRPVKTGEVREGRVEIIEGLKAGDLVVSAGHNKLRNGQPVTIDNSVQLDGKADGG
ncbi:membrane fusion protein (multidrug efflux system) [Thiogranum longum]|uniref:Membrane fusion protein (Multidrug efflux system) n=1 Tax=Thiogranum longum TaxID=1537524 RepID=A0A4R1HBA4_9GAMM|nr:efflux RND transporter periplasmic adaptor subunit [Thiogranum longum]TCK19244.1 membrane fusion protein (multidrug efflux system) [Thiogranum longum]